MNDRFRTTLRACFCHHPGGVLPGTDSLLSKNYGHLPLEQSTPLEGFIDPKGVRFRHGQRTQLLLQCALLPSPRPWGMV